MLFCFVRCLSSGTNAWTDTDHTCYTMTTGTAHIFLPVLGIRDILVRIRIHGSVPLTNGSGYDSFFQWKYGQKIFITYPQAHYFQSLIYGFKDKFCVKILFCKHYFSPGSGSLPLINWSGSRRPKTCRSGSWSPTLPSHRRTGKRPQCYRSGSGFHIAL